jgi:hypothetical protein
MIDILKLLSAFTQLIAGDDFPDAKTLSHALNLDLQKATVTKTKLQNLGIVGASLAGNNVNIACGVVPKREIWLIFDKPPISYLSVKQEAFGANQRIQPSQLGKGLAVIFDIHGLTCGYTTDQSETGVDALFCEEPAFTATPFQNLSTRSSQNRITNDRSSPPSLSTDVRDPRRAS